MNANVAKCLLVAKVLLADGMITEEEREFLDDLMRKLGLTEVEQKSTIALQGLAEAETMARALPEEDKHALLDLLVDAAAVDGRLARRELGVVQKLAAALGVER